ncbi:MAG TPA: STAS domain-containing protein [Candidatus Polarisedimenticolia bacterium]|nr:STAS domain-containing protein [Candidatus Polarisedimenticolia bacterium]
MRIRAQRMGRTLRLSLKGAVALGSAGGSLRQQVARALKDEVDHIEIDASGVRFLDAAALGELVACRAMARQAGAELRVSGVSGKARELLMLTGLDRKLLRGRHDGAGGDLRLRLA